jgi:hypothetical protein
VEAKSYDWDLYLCPSPLHLEGFLAARSRQLRTFTLCIGNSYTSLRLASDLARALTQGLLDLPASQRHPGFRLALLSVQSFGYAEYRQVILGVLVERCLPFIDEQTRFVMTVPKSDELSGLPPLLLRRLSCVRVFAQYAVGAQPPIINTQSLPERLDQLVVQYRTLADISWMSSPGAADTLSSLRTLQLSGNEYNFTTFPFDTVTPLTALTRLQVAAFMDLIEPQAGPPPLLPRLRDLELSRENEVPEPLAYTKILPLFQLLRTTHLTRLRLAPVPVEGLAPALLPCADALRQLSLNFEVTTVQEAAAVLSLTALPPMPHLQELAAETLYLNEGTDSPSVAFSSSNWSLRFPSLQRLSKAVLGFGPKLEVTGAPLPPLSALQSLALTDPLSDNVDIGPLLRLTPRRR